MNRSGKSLGHTSASLLLAMLLFSLPLVAQAQTADEAANNQQPESEDVKEEAKDADINGSLDDAKGSVVIDKVQRGISANWDLRGGYFGSDSDGFLFGKDTEGVWRARWRVAGTVGITPYLLGSVRIAGLCSDIDCEPEFVLTDYLPTTTSMEDGQVTLDETYLHWYRLDKFDLAVGRMQTKFVAHGGVFAKSLDRDTSNNTNVNWTDGIHGAYHAENGWVSHLIAEHNAPEGATEVRRGPLNFEDSGARVSYFLAFENLEPTRFLLQRGLDISYLPDSLLKNGTQSGPHEDYYGFVLRGSTRWPETDNGVRLRTAAEVGYAPETQTKAAAGLAGEGDVGGLAWNVVVSLMDFKPNHSIGVNYGQVEAGWLLSPQFAQNQSLAEIRYQWRKSKDLELAIRLRHRVDLEQPITSDGKLSDTDFFVRITWGGTL